MKEIMDTRLVEGYIFLFELLDMVGKECQHVFLAVIGLLPKCLVGQCADAAVALERALAYLEQHTQVLIVEKADAFRKRGLLPLRLHGQQQFVLTVEPFHQFLHPALEVVSCEQFHDLCPPFFRFAARAQPVVVEKGVYCHFLVPYGIVLQQPQYLGKTVEAASAYHHILDAVVGAHTLHGALAHVEHLRRLRRVKQLVFGFPLPFLLVPCLADVPCDVGNLRHQLPVGGTFHCYHIHIQSFFLVSAAKFGNKQRGL